MVGGEVTADGLGRRQLRLALWNGCSLTDSRSLVVPVRPLVPPSRKLNPVFRKKSFVSTGWRSCLFEYYSEYGSWRRFGYSKEKEQVLFTSLSSAYYRYLSCSHWLTRGLFKASLLLRPIGNRPKHPEDRSRICTQSCGRRPTSTPTLYTFGVTSEILEWDAVQMYAVDSG
jgi:hypothetical protein